MDSTERVATKAKLKELESQLADIKAEKIRRLEALKLYQKENAIEFFVPHGFQAQFLDALMDPTKKKLGMQAGNRCLGGETRIWDPVARVSRRVDEIKEPFHVIAWNGSGPVVAEASAPFEKGRDDLYEVTLSSGHQFVCSMSHQLLDPAGIYRPLRDYAVGSRLMPVRGPDAHVQPPSCLPTLDGQIRPASPVFPMTEERAPVRGSLSERGHDGSRTVRDSQSGCQACRRSCDEPLLLSASTAQGVLPSPDGAPVRTCVAYAEQTDDRGSTETHSRETRCDLRANGGCENRATRTWDTSLEDVAVASIRFLRCDVKYDLTVPTWHNYWAEGCFHHNSGKTHCLMASLVALMRGYYPWDPDKKTRFQPPIRIRLLGGDMSHHIQHTLVPKLKALYPKKFLAHIRKNNQGVEYMWLDVNGSSLEIMSYEQDVMTFESWNGHVVAYDEPPPRDKYIANTRGLVDNDGISLFAFTPLSEPWIHDELVASTDPTIAFFFATTHDNPHLSKQAIAEFEKSLSPEERAARIKGEWLFLQGLVYSEWKRPTHVIKPFKPSENQSVYAVLDTHPRAPHALSFVALDEKNRMFVVGERFEHGTPLEIADWIIEYHKSTHRITGVVIEPGSQGDSNRGDSTFEVIDKALHPHGIWLETGSRDLSGGILLVKEALWSRNGVPSLFVCENCTRTIWEFERYVWDDWRTSGIKTEKQKPRDKDDHFMENLRRAVQHPLEHAAPKVLKTYLEQATRPYRPVDSLAGY